MKEIRNITFYGRQIPVIEHGDDLAVIMNNIVAHLGLGQFRHQLVDTAMEILDLQIEEAEVYDSYNDRVVSMLVIPVKRINAWLSRFPSHFIKSDLYVRQEVLDEDGVICEDIISQKEIYDIYLGELVAGIYLDWRNGAPRHAPYQMGDLWRTACMTFNSALARFIEYSEYQGCDYSEAALRSSIRDFMCILLPEELVDQQIVADGYQLYSLAIVHDVIGRVLMSCVINQDDPYQCITQIDVTVISMLHEVSVGFLNTINRW